MTIERLRTLRASMSKRRWMRLWAAGASLLMCQILGAENPRCGMPLPQGSYRVSSPYGMRVHPISGVRRIHWGSDLASPVGTPVYAMRDGVVVLAGRCGCYGNVLVVVDSGNVVTLYAHLSRFAAGLRPGVAVKLGEFIGRVGATGCVTGPHLHFEVWNAGKRINPETACESLPKQPYTSPKEVN